MDESNFRTQDPTPDVDNVPGSTLQESTGSEAAWDLHELLTMHERTADEEADALRMKAVLIFST
jgi:hypothetical protein